MTPARLPPSAPPVSPPVRWWAKAWDSVSIYLPVLLMGGLALGSYWLVRTAPVPPLPVTQPALSDEPDYFMRGFSVRTLNAEGTLRHELRGREVRHYPQSGRLEVDEARLHSLNADGRLTTAQSMRLATNADQTVYDLRGEVQVVREAFTDVQGRRQQRLEFQGEALTVDMAGDRLASDLPVLMRRGSDTLQADRLRYDDGAGVADLQGRVKAVLAPRR